MDASIVSLGGQIQAIALAIGLILVIVLGARIFGLGPKGFVSLLTEGGAMLIAFYIIARPNDVAQIFIRGVGGIQAPTAIH